MPKGSQGPPLVVVLIDGINSSEPDSFTMNPLQPEGPAAAPGPGFGGNTYCPENPYTDLPDSATTPTFVGAQWNGQPSDGMDRFWSKWNFEASLPLDRTGNYGSPPPATNRFMLDPLAAIGAVILPFSYKDPGGATLTMSKGQPKFTFNGYGPIDSCCQELSKSASLLQQEVISINRTWPKADIVIIGHSLGGLIAEWWWEFTVRGNPSAENVSHVFSLDSPINGVKDACSSTFLGNIFLSKSFCFLWNGNYGKSPGLRDEYINGLDTNGTYVPIGTRSDPVYDCDGTSGCGFPSGGYDVPLPGLLSQVLFNSLSSCTNETTSCSPFGASFVSPSECDITKADNNRQYTDFDGKPQSGTGHFVVKYCPAVVELVREIVIDGDLHLGGP